MQLDPESSGRGGLEESGRMCATQTCVVELDCRRLVSQRARYRGCQASASNTGTVKPNMQLKPDISETEDETQNSQRAL